VSVASLVRIRVSRGTSTRTVDLDTIELHVGRAVACAVRLAEDDIAPEHAVVHLGTTWTLEARGGPVVLGTRRLAPGERAPLAEGAEWKVGGWTLSVSPSPSGAVAAGAERTASLARELIRDLLGGEDQGGGPVLQVEIGPDPGRRIALPTTGERLVIGRGEGSTCVILDPDLSRQHFAVDRTWDGVRVVDLGSKNGTLVAGAPAPTTEPGALLRDGELLAAGATRLRLVDPAERYLHELESRVGDSTVSSTPTLSTVGPPRTAGVITAGAAATPRPVHGPGPGAPASRWPLWVAAVIAIAALGALVALLV
jgi:pSer/pThr/pTyr-binding forkhead associated (FHA) protein